MVHLSDETVVEATGAAVVSCVLVNHATVVAFTYKVWQFSLVLLNRASKKALSRKKYNETIGRFRICVLETR